VDVERVRADVGAEEIARRYFPRAEWAALAALPAERRAEAFVARWTRREASAKALGSGLEAALGEDGTPPGFRCRELMPAPGYVGALAVEGDDWEIKCWEAIAPLSPAWSGRYHVAGCSSS
jgi:4'-phosphopantetheinyl transferase